MNQKKKSTGSSKPKKSSIIPPMMHIGLWEIVFSYIGTPKTIFPLRKVCKSWKKVYKKYLESYILDMQRAIDSQKSKNNGQSILTNIPSDIEDEVKEGVRLKEKYAGLLGGINKRRLQHMGFMVQPPLTISLAYASLINFILTNKQLRELSWKNIDWFKCKNMIVKIDFIKKLEKVTPESVQADQIKRFQDVLQAGVLNVGLIRSQSNTTADLVEWAETIIEYIKHMKNACQETRDFMKRVVLEQDSVRELESYVEFGKKMP